MKSVGVALLSSVFTAILVLFALRDRLIVRPMVQTDTLIAREIHIVDGTGAVRMTLGTHGRGAMEGSPALDLLPRGSGSEGVELLLDADGRGALRFDTKDGTAKVLVGHFVGCDTVPLTESCHGWGLSVLNRTPVIG